MRTPKEAFNAMCSCHGEIWALSNKGWSCTRKAEDGIRFIDRNKVEPPMPVRELMVYTASTFVLFHTLTDHVEILASSADMSALIALRTPEQKTEEAHRVATQTTRREQMVEEIKQMAVEEVKLWLAKHRDISKTDFIPKPSDDHSIN